MPNYQDTRCIDLDNKIREIKLELHEIIMRIENLEKALREKE